MYKRTRSQSSLRDDSSKSARRSWGTDDTDPLATPPSTPSKRQKCSPSDRLPTPPSTPSKRQKHSSSEKTLSIRDPPPIIPPEENAESQDTKENSTPSDIFKQAKALFRRTTSPSQLVGRSHERERMMDFWNRHVLGNKPGALYVSGAPGTGKTAMLNEILRNTQNDIKALSTHRVKVVMINCMTVTEPKAIYTKLVEEFKSPQTTLQKDIIKQAEYLLNGKKDVLSVIILDEIDHLATRGQDVLYKLFEWASAPASRVVLIGIANALDLTSRLLPRLRAKNCEPALLNFNPYQVSEISDIIKSRLLSLSSENPKDNSNIPLPLMQPVAVELCARKVAATMGDMRIALDVCRQAIEVAEMEYKRKTSEEAVLSEQTNASQPIEPKVTIAHVMKVIQSLFGSPTVQKLKQLNLQQKVVICVLYVMSQKASNSKKDPITLGKFREQYPKLCAKSGKLIRPVSRTELTDLLAIVETGGFVTLGKSKEEQARRIHLNVHAEEVDKMIEEVPVLRTWMNAVF